MKKCIVVFVLFIFFSEFLNAESLWTSWHKSPIVLSIAFEDDIVWCGTENEGVIAYNKTTGTQRLYTTDDGLFSNTVTCIAVDHNEVKWFGTNNGLSRFDGSTWDKFISQPVSDIAISNTGALFGLTTLAGLFTIDGSEWSTVKKGNFNCILIDEKDTIWLGSKESMGNNYILRIDGTEETVIGKDTFIQYNPIEDMAYDSIGNKIWYVTSKGFYTYNIDSDTVIKPDLHTVSYQRIVIDHNGTVWIGNDDGLKEYRDGTLYDHQIVTSPYYGKVWSLNCDNNGIIWIGTRGGLYSIDGSIAERHLSCIYSDEVMSIVIDNEGKIWCSHSDDSSTLVSCFYRNIWNVGLAGLGEFLCVDKNGTIWSHRGSTLFKYNGAVSKYNIVYEGVFDDGSDQSVGDIQNIYIDGTIIWGVSYTIPMDSGSGFWWIDMSDTDNYKYDDKQGYYVIPGHAIFKADCTDFAVDSAKNFWIGTIYNGLYKYDGTTLTRYSEAEGLSGNSISSVEVDRNDNVWFGVLHPRPREEKSFSSLYSFNGITFTEYTAENSGLEKAQIYSLACDHNNTKWIGTDAGVVRFGGETWTTFNTQNSGLCDNKVNAIAVEKNNTIWFGTDNGVSRYTGEMITTSVDENTTIPQSLLLIRSYPNHFNPSTTIGFTLPEAGSSTLIIYNIAGQKVRGLVAESMTAGRHTAVWDGKDDSGAPVSAGIYFTRLTCGRRTATGKMVMVK
ncbi:hypothetical protein LLG96_19170 [bacterium]|nr:hypothetical protein [bacterium]